MNEIPISFELNGEKFQGHLTNVAGAGSTAVFHLMDDKGFYNGRLRMVLNKWAFDPTPKTKDLIELTDYCGQVIQQWYE